MKWSFLNTLIIWIEYCILLMTAGLCNLFFIEFLIFIKTFDKNAGYNILLACVVIYLHLLFK